MPRGSPESIRLQPPPCHIPLCVGANLYVGIYTAEYNAQSFYTYNESFFATLTAPRHHDCQRQWIRNSIFGSMTFRALVAYQFLQNDSGNKVISGSFEICAGEKERLLYPTIHLCGFAALAEAGSPTTLRVAPSGTKKPPASLPYRPGKRDQRFFG
jgi:hypothetical protein